MLEGISSVCCYRESRNLRFAYRASGRVAQQLWNDPATKIDEFTDAFRQLRIDLDTGTLQQTTIAISKISKDVEILGIPITFPT